MKTTMKKIKLPYVLGLLLFLSTFLLPNIIEAATYYVSTTGDDNNNGLSEATPFRTFTKINSVSLSPGDNVLLKRGDLFEETTTLAANTNGTLESRITDGAYGTGVNPQISNNTTHAIEIRYSYITFDSIDVLDAASNGFHIYGTITNPIISNLSITNANNGIYLLQTAVNLEITNVKISNSGRGIYILGPVSDLEITDTEIFSNSNNGIDIYSSTTTNGVTMDNVNVHSNASDGFAVRKASDITISNSRFDSNRSGFKMGGHTDAHIETMSISDTTFSDNSSIGFYIVGSSGGIGADNITLHDIVANNNGTEGISLVGGSTSLIRDFLIYNTTTNGNGATGIRIGSLSVGVVRDSSASSNDVGYSVSGSAEVNFLRVSALSNSEDGFNGFNSAEIICDACIANDNGIDGTGGNGDGFSWHNQSTGIIRNSYASNNKKSAIANVDSSVVKIYNNIFTHVSNGTLPMVFNSETTTIDNNIFYNPSNEGTAQQAVSSDTTIRNNIVYGFSSGFLGSAESLNSYNLMYNVLNKEYACLSDDDCITSGEGAVISDPLFINRDSEDFTLSYLSPAIDAGTVVSERTTDKNGNPIYGTPDIGPFEYQPPYEIGDGVISKDAIRIYGDGMYRNISSNAVSNVNLDVEPQDGYSAQDKDFFMDISSIIWNEAVKSWDASSDVEASVSFTVGSLVPEATYQIKVDDVVYSTVKANDSGVLSFDYNGGWSLHTFEVSQIEETKSTRRRDGDTSITSRIKNLTEQGNFELVNELTLKFPNAAVLPITNTQILALIADLQAQIQVILAEQGGTTQTTQYTRDLDLSAEGADVTTLQNFLMTQGMTIPAGATGYFGPQTQAALIQFQLANDIAPAVGYFGPITRAFIK